MAILKPLIQRLAEDAQDAFEIAFESVVKSISSDPRSFTEQPFTDEPVFRPCREGKSLYSPVKSRTIFKRKTFSRWSEE